MQRGIKNELSWPKQPVPWRAIVSGLIHYWLPTMLLGPLLTLRAAWAGRGKSGSVNPPRSILVIRLDHIGDLVLCSAMFRELRRLYPLARITAVVSTRTKALLDSCPYVDEVIGKLTQPNSLRTLFKELAITREFCKRCLAGRSFDMAIVPRWDTDGYFATLMCLYSNATERVAFTERCSPQKSIVNWGFDAFYTRVLPAGPLGHEAEKNLDIVRNLGGRIENPNLELWPSGSDYGWAEDCLASFGPEDCLIAFGIGASNARCRWPVASYAALIDDLARHTDFTPVVICGPDDAQLVAEMARNTKVRLLIPERPTLGQTTALLSRCELFVGNDSGPMHLAAASGVPIVEISCHPMGGDPFGQHSPERFGPFAREFTVLRPRRAKPPCGSSCTSAASHCITDITTGMVTGAVMPLLRSRERVRA